MTAKKSTKTKKQAWSTLTLQDVKDLGTALLHVGDKYPLLFVTEEDFYPLVEAYLHGRVPKVEQEYSVEDGWIDFRVGNTSNPAYLELAVAPRQLVDRGVTSAIIGGKFKMNVHRRTKRPGQPSTPTPLSRNRAVDTRNNEAPRRAW